MNVNDIVTKLMKDTKELGEFELTKYEEVLEDEHRTDMSYSLENGIAKLYMNSNSALVAYDLLGACYRHIDVEIGIQKGNEKPMLQVYFDDSEEKLNPQVFLEYDTKQLEKNGFTVLDDMPIDDCLVLASPYANDLIRELRDHNVFAPEGRLDTIVDVMYQLTNGQYKSRE